MADAGGADFEAERARMVERQLRRRGIDDERVLEAMGRGAARAVRPGGRPRAAPTRFGAADRPPPDDLPAVGGGGDLPGAAADAATRRCWRSAPARATRPPCWRELARQVHQRRADPRAGRARPGDAGASSASRTSRWCWRDGSRGYADEARPTTRSPSTPPRPEARTACSPSSRPAGAWSCRSPPASADLLTAFHREGEEDAAPGDDRPLPLRPADRRRGLRRE